MILIVIFLPKRSPHAVSRMPFLFGKKLLFHVYNLFLERGFRFLLLLLLLKDYCHIRLVFLLAFENVTPFSQGSF